MEKALKVRKKERFPEQRHPGDPEPERGLPGSIEQQLDMCEEGSLRGDDLLHRHGAEIPGESRAMRGEPLGVDELMARQPYAVDMAEEGREGSEWSGDEHSGGMQGGESELQWQPHLSSGLPGEQTRHEQYFEGHSLELEAAGFLPDELDSPLISRRNEASREAAPRVKWSRKKSRAAS